MYQFVITCMAAYSSPLRICLRNLEEALPIVETAIPVKIQHLDF